MCYASAEDLSKSVRAAVFAARENLAPDEWIERNWKVQSGERQGSLMDLSRTPYLRLIARAFDVPGVTDIVFMGPAQSGKTEIVFAIMAWTMAQRPGTWMVMLPKAQKAEDNNVTRFLPAIEANEGTARLLVGEQKRALVTFRGGQVHFIGSESLSGAEGTPAKYVWVDEYDRCDETGRDKVEQRGKTFAGRKRLKTGTPGMAGEGIDAAYSACDARFALFVPCPHCLHYHTRTWDKSTVVWEGGNDAPIEDVRRNAWYQCGRCKGKCQAKHRAWQASLGEWLAQTQTIGPVRRKKAEPGSENRATEDDQPGIVSGKIPEGTHWGIAFLGLDNELQVNPVGEVAGEFLRRYRAHGRPGEVWETETLGRAVKIRARRVEIEHLKARATASPHVRGVAPEGTVAIYAGMDVQTDRAFWMTVAIGRGMNRVSILDWGEIKNVVTEADLDRAVRWVKAKRYEVVNGWPMQVMQVACDTGHRAVEVYQVKARVGQCMKLVKGESSRDGKNKDLSRMSQTAVEQVAPLPLLIVNVTPWKTTAAGLLMRGFGVKKDVERKDSGPEVGDETLEDAGMVLDLPRNVDEELLAQLCSERYTSGLWQLIKEGLPNHWWDCLIYILAASVYYGARGMTRRRDVPKAPEMTHGEQERRSERESVGGGGGSKVRGLLTG